MVSLEGSDKPSMYKSWKGLGDPSIATSYKQKPRTILICPRLHGSFTAKVGLEFRSPEFSQYFCRMQTSPL